MADFRDLPENAFRDSFLALIGQQDDATWAGAAERAGRCIPEQAAAGHYVVLREEESLPRGDQPLAVAEQR